MNSVCAPFFPTSRQSATCFATPASHESRVTTHESLSSNHFPLCFSLFFLLSATTRVTAGAAAAIRALRRASFPFSRVFFLLRIYFPLRLPPHPTPTTALTRPSLRYAPGNSDLYHKVLLKNMNNYAIVPCASALPALATLLQFHFGTPPLLAGLSPSSALFSFLPSLSP